MFSQCHKISLTCIYVSSIDMHLWHVIIVHFFLACVMNEDKIPFSLGHEIEGF